MSQWLHQIFHAAAREKKDTKLAGVALIIIGLCFTPWLIGIPIVVCGFRKLFSSPTKAS